MRLPCPHCGTELRVAVDDLRLDHITIEGRCLECSGHFDIASLVSRESGPAGEADETDESTGHRRPSDRPTIPDAPRSRRASTGGQSGSLLGRVARLQARVPRQRRARLPSPAHVPQFDDEEQPT